jgi:hypothetical protein
LHARYFDTQEEGKYSSLVNLPTPTKYHSDTISELLQEIFLMYGVSEMEREARQKVANEIDGYISKSLPGKFVRLMWPTGHCTSYKLFQDVELICMVRH